MQPGDVPATFADVQALSDAVGFAPATPIEVGVGGSWRGTGVLPGLKPAADLAYDTAYVATIAGTVATASGVTLGDDASWSFTTEAAPAEDDAIDGVTVTPASADLDVGDTVQLAATVSVVSGSPSTAVTWSTDDDTVATVDATGLVSAVGAGTANITATSDFDGAFSGFAVITVTEPEDVIDGVSVTPGSGDLGVEATTTLQLTATVSVVSGSPSTAVTWSTDDDTVATVDATGLVTAVGAGTANITATSDFDGAFGDSASITVHAAPALAGDYAPYAGEANVFDGDFSMVFPTVTGGFGTLSFALSSGALPGDFVVDDGIDVITYTVELDPATGEIAGSTGFPGEFSGEVTVSDELGQQATAAFEIDLELTVNIADGSLGLDTTQTVFAYPAFTEVFFPIPGNRIQVSGVGDTTWLDPDFLDDVTFSLVYVTSQNAAGDTQSPTPGEIASFVINTGDGTVSQIAEVLEITRWVYDHVAVHTPSGKTLTNRVGFHLNTVDPPIFPPE
jgi:hypothetical protein